MTNNNTTSTTGLYSFRPLEPESAQFLSDWMIESSIPYPVPMDELHCTIVNSTVDVPSYVPGADPVTALPSTFQLAMLNNALVISFTNSTLQDQHYRAIGMGATDEFQHFLPHISVSYKIPESFSLEDIKPPSLPMVFGAEVRQHQNLDWATAMASMYEMKYVIDSFTLHDFMWFLEERGVIISHLKLPLTRLIATQAVGDWRIRQMVSIPLRSLSSGFLLSNENMLFDAEAHLRLRALVIRTPACSVPVFRANITNERLTRLYEEYAGT